MKITEVKLRLVDKPLRENEDGVVAYASIVLDDELAVKGIRLVKIQKRYLASMPNREVTKTCNACNTKNPLSHKRCKNCGAPLKETPEKEYLDMVHPVTQRLRNHIEAELLKAYQESINARHPVDKGG